MDNRLSKVLAHYGVASRRKAEELIQMGRVSVNGMVITKPETQVSSQKDSIFLDGVQLKKIPKKTYYLLNKPRGVVCSEKRFKLEHIIFDLLPKTEGRLFTIGRLDKDSTGLILITNDGEFANNVIHPSKKIDKEYIVKTRQEITHNHLVNLSKGGFVEGSFVKPVSVQKVRKGTSRIVLSEGKKREVRRLYEKAGLEVLELTRIRIGGLLLGSLPEGAFRPLTETDKLALFS